MYQAVPALFAPPNPGNKSDHGVMMSRVDITQSRYPEMKASSERLMFVFLTHVRGTFSEFYTFPFNNKSVTVGGTTQ